MYAVLIDEICVHPAASVQARRPDPDVSVVGAVADDLHIVAVVQLSDLVVEVVAGVGPDRQPPGLQTADLRPRSFKQADLAVCSAGNIFQFLFTDDLDLCINNALPI